MANRVTDVSGESVIHGITSEVSKQRAGCVCVCGVCVCGVCVCGVCGVCVCVCVI